MSRKIVPLGNGPLINMGKPQPKFSLQMDTQIAVDAEIRQQLKLNDKVISQWFIKTKEEQVRKALIEIGWTPPQDESETPPAEDGQ